ncbi:MAG: hypothetical protein GY716_08190 [bacterium]|nr:hypothetical protein [bacterium]
MDARSAWRKYGCIGCLGLVALVLTIVLVVAGLALLTARPEQMESRVLTPEVVGGGRVVLAIEAAELHVRPAVPGESLRVEARFDVNAFALEGELDPGAGGDWIYRVTFGAAEDSGAFSGLMSVARGSPSRVDVFLPVDSPLDLVLNLRKGGAVVRLGGLRLRSAELEFESGAVDLDVDEPLREPMQSLSISTTSAGALINNLGNASPRRLDVTYRMGQIDMGLLGNWVADAEISIDGGTGGGVVHLPSGVVLEGLERRGVAPPREPRPDLPTLRFTVSTGMGWLEFSDWAMRDNPSD